MRVLQTGFKSLFGSVHSTMVLLAVVAFAATAALASEPAEVQVFVAPGSPGAGKVLVQRSDYLRLLEGADRAGESTGSDAVAPWAEAAEAEYVVTPGYPFARIDARYRLGSGGDGWASLELAGPGARVLEAVLEGDARHRLLPGAADGRYLLRPAPGLSARQRLLAPVTRDGDRFSLELPVPRASINRMRVESSSGYDGFALSRGVLDASSRGGAFPPSRTMRLTWSTATAAAAASSRDAAEPAQDVRAQIVSDAQLLAHVSERTIRVRGRYDLEVKSRPVARTVVALPPGLAVVDARSPLLADWSVQSAERGSQLLVEWKAPLLGNARLQVTFELSREDDQPFELGLPALPGAYREKLLLAVSARPNLQVETAVLPPDVRNLDPARAPQELLDAAGDPITLLFSSSRIGSVTASSGSGPASRVLRLGVIRHEQVKVLTAVADLAEVATHLSRDGTALWRARFLVKNNSEQFLRIQIPAAARVLDCFVSEHAVVPARPSGSELLIPLEKSGVENTQAAAFPVELTYQVDGTPLASGDEAVFSLPQIHLPVSTLRWKLGLPEELQALPVETSMHADPVYREVSYAGESDGKSSRVGTLRLFEETAPPLRVPFPSMEDVAHFSQDILDPLSAAPFLKARLQVRQSSRPQRSLAFVLAMTLAFGMVLHRAGGRGRRHRAVSLLVVSGIAVGVTSFQPDALALGLYFALGLFLGVAASLVRWAAEWRPAPAAAEIPMNP